MHDDSKLMFDDDNLRQTHKKAVIITAAILSTMALYLVLGELFLKNLIPGISPAYNQLKYILIAVAAVDAVVMVILKRRALTANTPSSKENKPSRQTLEKTGLQRLLSSSIIGAALGSSIATLGLVLFLLGKDQTEFYTFIGIAMFLTIVHFPKYEDWKTRLQDFLDEY